MDRPSPNKYAVLTEDGEVMPCSLLTWATFLEHSRQRVIAQENLEGGYTVSTIFMGLNLNLDPKGPVLWFETMIFAPSSDCGFLGRPIRRGIYTDRYETLKEAIAGHAAAKHWFERQDDVSVQKPEILDRENNRLAR